MEIKKTYYPKNRKEWRSWLAKNHKKDNEIWVIYYKKHTGKPRVSYNDAVEEALCYGWIDSTAKRIDDEKYCQKFTPRNIKSFWSDLNKKRVESLIENGQMTKFGLEKIEIAKNNGMWDKKVPAAHNYEMDLEFQNRLKKDKEIELFFNSLPPSHKRNYFAWIGSAKKEETKKRRIEKALNMLKNKEKSTMF